MPTACFSRPNDRRALHALLATFVLAPFLLDRATAAPAQAPARAAKAWTVDDILLAESAGEAAISPDGRRAVLVKTAMDKEKGERVSNLVLTTLGDEPVVVELTRGKDRSSRPQWSPDGKMIAFSSTRGHKDTADEEGDDDDAKTQLWLANAAGGEPWQLTKLDRGIVDFAWRDAATLVVAAPEAKSFLLQRTKEAKDTSETVEDPQRTPPVRLFAVALKDGALTRLSEDSDWIEWVKVSPDGRWAVALHQQSLSFRYDQRTPPVLRLHDLAHGGVRTLLEGRRVLPLATAWAPDSKTFYLVRAHSSHPTYFEGAVQVVEAVDAESGASTPVELDWAKGIAYGSKLLPLADGFLALLADGVRYRPTRYTRAAGSWRRQDLTGSHVSQIFDWALGGDGVVAYEQSTASQPPRWYAAQLAGSALQNEKTLLALNPGFDGKPVHRMEVVHWKGARDEEVEGLLYYPLGYEAGKKYPLVLTIHGGPAGEPDRDAWLQDWDYPKLLLAQRGALLLEANYHGSSDYGLDWVESICCGNYYDLERVDLERGVDYVIGRGLADPDRLGTLGWSNGSILTTELVTRSHRFKAASAGAGDVEWISDWGNVDFGASFDNYYFGKAPYEDPELYIRKSPYFRLKDVTTPMIVYTGTEDRNVPPSQSWSHFRVMQQVGKAPVRFVLFPGEPHGLQKYAHQKRKVEEDLAWFDRYLFGKPPAESVVKEGSPLEAALARRSFARVAGRYGTRVAGRLVPEAVDDDGLRVSRFETTRAQFAAFDAGYPVPPGTENFPANRISFERAAAFAAWLARLTGQGWRLPRAEELQERCAASKADDENTLDRWAGYAVNPEDAAALRERAKALGGTAPLLEEVGRHRARGDLYDLAGNVAEWATGAAGTGVLVCGSADQAEDAARSKPSAGEAYRGFRVVGETKDPSR